MGMPGTLEALGLTWRFIGESLTARVKHASLSTWDLMQISMRLTSGELCAYKLENLLSSRSL
jgi:hypothetical protein